MESEGDTDIDAIGEFDQRGIAPPVRRIGAAWDLEVPPPQWPALRAAAQAGQAAFDGHIAGAGWMQPAARALYAALPGDWREAVRRGALGLAL